jgi:hypothetical protein
MITNHHLHLRALNILRSRATLAVVYTKRTQTTGEVKFLGIWPITMGYSGLQSMQLIALPNGIRRPHPLLCRLQVQTLADQLANAAQCVYF